MCLQTGHVDADFFGTRLVARDETRFVQTIDGVTREARGACRLRDARHDKRFLWNGPKAAVSGGQEVKGGRQRGGFGGGRILDWMIHFAVRIRKR